MSIFAAQVTNEATAPTSHDYVTEALRLSIRKLQVALLDSPDLTSPWWFLVDPSAPFETSA